jgi:hypothetical protein
VVLRFYWAGFEYLEFGKSMDHPPWKSGTFLGLQFSCKGNNQPCFKFYTWKDVSPTYSMMPNMLGDFFESLTVIGNTPINRSFRVVV